MQHTTGWLRLMLAPSSPAWNVPSPVAECHAPAPDGMAYFTILTDLPRAVSMYAALHKAEGSPSGPRSHGAIMADTAFQRITDYQTSAQVPLEIGLVITDQTLLADGRAAERIGQYAVPAEIARHLITAALAAKPNNWSEDCTPTQPPAR